MMCLFILSVAFANGACQTGSPEANSKIRTDITFTAKYDTNTLLYNEELNALSVTLAITNNTVSQVRIKRFMDLHIEDKMGLGFGYAKGGGVDYLFKPYISPKAIMASIEPNTTYYQQYSLFDFGVYCHVSDSGLVAIPSLIYEGQEYEAKRTVFRVLRRTESMIMKSVRINNDQKQREQQLMPERSVEILKVESEYWLFYRRGFLVNGNSKEILTRLGKLDTHQVDINIMKQDDIYDTIVVECKKDSKIVMVKSIVP